MKLTVLGKSPAWSDAGGACSGYLVEEANSRIVIDCGNGVFGKLRERVDYAAIDAVVISHLHGDHVLDLVPFSYALTYGPAGRARPGRPRLIAPEGAAGFFNRLDGTWNDEGLIVGAFDLVEYGADSEAAVGELRIRSHAVPHIGATHAIEVTAASGARIVCGADGRYSEELIAAAAGADLLLAEATLEDPDPSQHVHMSAIEAGRLATEAGVGRLVLTHISDELDLNYALGQASSSFEGPVEIAAGGSSFEV